MNEIYCHCDAPTVGEGSRCPCDAELVRLRKQLSAARGEQDALYEKLMDSREEVEASKDRLDELARSMTYRGNSV